MDVKKFQIWNRAVETVRGHLVALSDQLRLTGEQHRIMWLAIRICDAQAYPADQAGWKSNEELARKYHCSRRTICNWRRRGAPLLRGQWRMLDWLVKQRWIPRSTEQHFAKQLAHRRGEEPEGPDSLRSLLRQARQLEKLMKLVRSGAQVSTVGTAQATGSLA
jgi:hypothetical protein